MHVVNQVLGTWADLFCIRSWCVNELMDSDGLILPLFHRWVVPESCRGLQQHCLPVYDRWVYSPELQFLYRNPFGGFIFGLLVTWSKLRKNSRHLLLFTKGQSEKNIFLTSDSKRVYRCSRMATIKGGVKRWFSSPCVKHTHDDLLQ